MTIIFRTIFFILISLIISGCQTHKNKIVSPPVESTLKDTVLSNKYDRGKELSGSSEKNDLFIEKLRNNIILDSKDCEDLANFLISNNDESLSEEVGYLLYQYLKGSGDNIKSFEKFLSKKEGTLRNSIFLSIIQLLCLDLGEDNYTYERLIKDFPIFKGNEVIRSAFKNCMSA